MLRKSWPEDGMQIVRISKTHQNRYSSGVACTLSPIFHQIPGKQDQWQLWLVYLLQFSSRLALATLGWTAVSGLARIQKMMALSLVPS